MKIFRGLISWLKGSEDREENWPTIVILLKEPLFPTAEEIIRIGQSSWGAHEKVELVGTTNNGRSCVLRTGKLFCSVSFAPQSYAVFGQEKSEAQQRPWQEHTAWLSIDMPTQRTESLRQAKALSDSYKLLLIFAFKFWSLNCLGVYFPCEGVTIPNLGELAESVRWARRNGVNLAFLDD